MRLRRLTRLRLIRGTPVVMGELACLTPLTIPPLLIRAVDLTARPRATDVLGAEAEEEEEEDAELPSGGSKPCDLRRLLLMAEIPGRILN